MEGIKKAIRQGYVSTMIITLILGILITLIMFKDWLPIGEVQDLDYLMDINDLKPGRATITAYYTPDYYMAYTEGSDDNEVERCYIIPVGGEDEGTWAYIGLHLWGNKNKTAYTNMNLILDSEDDEWVDQVVPMRLSGRVKEMDSDNEYYRADYIDYYVNEAGESREELEALFGHYIFVPNRITGAGESAYIYVAVIFGIVFLAIGIYYLFQLLFGDPLKLVNAYGKKHNGVEDAMAKADYLLNSQTPVCGMRGDDSMFLYYYNKRLLVFDPKDMLWAFEQVTKRKSGLITVGKDYSVVIKLADGSQEIIPCTAETVTNYLHAVQKVCPDIILGYSDELKRMYNKDRDRMVAEINRRKEERLYRSAMTASSYSDSDSMQNYATENVSNSAPALEPQYTNPVGVASQEEEASDDYAGSSYNYNE